MGSVLEEARFRPRQARGAVAQLLLPLRLRVTRGRLRSQPARLADAAASESELVPPDGGLSLLSSLPVSVHRPVEHQAPSRFLFRGRPPFLPFSRAIS